MLEEIKERAKRRGGYRHERRKGRNLLREGEN